MSRFAEISVPHRIVATALAAACLLLAVVTGCGTGNPYPPGSYERGVYFVEKENRVEAVAALESFVRHNPTDSLAAEAQFLKAMTTMEMKEFPLAAVEFQILRKDYPTSERVEEAFFQEGVAYYRQSGRIERDISGAIDARRHFQDFLVKYPETPLRAQAEEYLLEISDLVVKKRLRQCKVFRQLNRPEAIVLALESILKQEPGSRLIDRVLLERGKIAEKLDDTAAAEAAYSRLVAEHPESDLADDARSALDGLREAEPAPADEQ